MAAILIVSLVLYVTAVVFFLIEMKIKRERQFNKTWDRVRKRLDREGYFILDVDKFPKKR